LFRLRFLPEVVKHSGGMFKMCWKMFYRPTAIVGHLVLFRVMKEFGKLVEDLTK